MILDEIKQSKRLKTSINKNENVDFEMINIHESSNLNFEYYSIRRTYLLEQYNAIKQTDINLMNESNVSFLEGMKNILLKFIELIKKLFDKFVNFLKKMRESFLATFRKSKVNISRLTDTDITFKGYKYTLDNIPYTNLNMLTRNGDFSFSREKADMLEKEDVKRIELIVADESYYEEVRGNILGTKKVITKDEFKDEIKRLFRNGEYEEKEIHFNDYKTVQQLHDDIVNYRDILEQIKKQKEESINEYKKLIKYFDNLVDVRAFSVADGDKPRYEANIRTFEYTSDSDMDLYEYNSKKIDIIRKYGIARSKEANKMSQMISDVFAGKIEAVQEQYKQDSALLKALIKKN